MNTLLLPSIKGLKLYCLLITCTFIGYASAQDWKWVNPTPTGNQLNGVKLVDSSVAYAIGNYGTILKSTDGGLQWTIQNSNTNSDLLSVSAISKDTVYVSTRDLSVLKTTDGGANWRKVRNGSPGSGNTSQVFFITSAIGYLLGDNLEQFYKTTDGANTWTKLPADMDFQGVTSIYFTSADTGYASVGNGMGGVTLKTTDGGYNWTSSPLPVGWSFNAIVFTDSKTGYLAGNLGHILKTQDAGISWQIQNQFPSSLTNSNLVCIDFVDQDTGFIVGATEILKTTDRGNHWQIAAKSAFDLRAVSFVDTDHGICVGGDWLHEFSGIISSTNGGINWKESSSTFTDRYIRRIKFVNSTTGYAVGGSGSTNGGFILKTTDTGNTWTTINTGLDNYYISDLSLPDENTLYLVGPSGQILKSGDAGASWQKQNSNTTESLTTVFFLDAQNGYAAGENQTILKTSNGGITWTKQLCPKTQHNYSAFFKDINTGYIASYDWEVDSCTILLTTIDGGLNWKSKRIGRLRYPSKIIFVNQDTAFIAGDFGAMLKTTDGGNHWSPLYFHGNSFYDLFFSTENTGYAIGEDGEILMTENCGKDWIVLDSGTEKDLLSICFSDVNTGFAVGSNGIILKTTNSGSSLKALRQGEFIVCKDQSELIQPNFIGGKKPLTWLWSNSETTPTISVIGDQTTTYQVTVRDADNDTIQMMVPVMVPLIPTPVIRMQNDTIISSERYGVQWFRNDSLLTDTYTNWLVPISDGDYYCVVNDYNCKSEKSNVIQIFGTAAGEIRRNEVQIYPNPVFTQLNIELAQTNNECVLVLMDTQGKEMLRRKTSTEKTQLDMSNLPGGIYFIQIISKDMLMTKKILKK